MARPAYEERLRFYQGDLSGRSHGRYRLIRTARFSVRLLADHEGLAEPEVCAALSSTSARAHPSTSRFGYFGALRERLGQVGIEFRSPAMMRFMVFFASGFYG